MEIWQFIGESSPGVAVAVLCLYFYNVLTVRYLDERKDMLQGLAAERKEWNDKLERLLDRYDLRTTEFAAVGRDMINQIHGLKGELQKWMLNEGRNRQAGGDK